MKGTKRLIFWGLTLFFCVSNFIRLFIHDDFGKTIRVYFRDVPVYLKVIFLSCSYCYFGGAILIKKKKIFLIEVKQPKINLS